MDKNDFETFKKEVSWFVEQNDKVEIRHIICKTLSPKFVDTFPTLNKLLLQATSLLSIDIINQKNIHSKYTLYTWISKNNLKCGWLCKNEQINTQIEILPEHQLLLDEMGGIQESYSQLETDKEMLTDNQNFIFIKSGCRKGLDEWTELYNQTCEYENAKKIDTKNLVCFVCEANGNETFCDLKTKQIYLFAPDHSFDNVKVLEGQPEFTFYTINGVTTFVDYVEMLAQQWIENIVVNN